MKVRIKPAYDEIDSVKELFTQYTEMLGVNLDFQNYEQELEHLPGKYALPDGRLYIACADNKAIGCIALRKINDTICEMKRLYVRPEFRGKKISQLLAEQIISDAAKLKYEYMVLDTFTSLKSAIALYKKLGFYEIEPYYQNPLENVVYMRLEL
ncbi:MAG: GNAT family N-acetyltransferase [Syntrophomonadaceae bacterium]|nr:GNAT family N-acetyltransferase [Syntrophomonadaceae bacterium]MDD3890251.1 GNAT family N-acetyltransferase [Syntrophomonadaceae bacterium]MDD4550439.1 GNAT family N-acetyltransferase [Syntrophomonadaceae bacterium]